MTDALSKNNNALPTNAKNVEKPKQTTPAKETRSSAKSDKNSQYSGDKKNQSKKTTDEYQPGELEKLLTTTRRRKDMDNENNEFQMSVYAEEEDMEEDEDPDELLDYVDDIEVENATASKKMDKEEDDTSPVSKEVDFEKFKNRPHVQQFLRKLYGETVDAAVENKKKPQNPITGEEKTKQKERIKVKSKVVKLQKEAKDDRAEIEQIIQESGRAVNLHAPTPILNGRSKSASTIYQPALKMKRLQHVSPSEFNNQLPSPYQTTNQQIDPNMIPSDSVENILAQIRLDKFPGDEGGKHKADSRPQSPRVDKNAQMEERGPTSLERAKDRTDHILLEAERQKAKVLAPTGVNAIVTAPAVNYNFSDDHPDNMFTVTNHVEQVNINKIAAGGFIETV